MESSEGPAPPDPTPAPAEPAPQFRSTRARRYIVAPFWAGLLGGGVLGWTFPFLAYLRQAEVFKSRHEKALVCFALLFAITVALWRGYREPIRSYASLFGRILGIVFFGGACVGIVLALFIALFEALHVRDQTA